MALEIFRDNGDYLFGQNDLGLGMTSNGFIIQDGEWKFDPEVLKETLSSNTNRGQRVSFYGPQGMHSPEPFFSIEEADPNLFTDALSQQSVRDTIAKYRKHDTQQAKRIAYLLGGIVRYSSFHHVPSADVMADVDFAAKIAILGEEKSGDAITSAVSMYVLSGGSTEEDNDFKGWVYRMSDAIKDDPVIPSETQDLGLSQVSRLRNFVDRFDGRKQEDLPDLHDEIKTLDGFPTVGAEFHLPPRLAMEHKTLLKRLAILNMSQHQDGSYIQFSRHDRGVLEIRMNPSIYPITIANWNYIRKLIPEIQDSFFTITLNRPDPDANFNWKDESSRQLLYKLRKLGFLSYAAVFDDVPPQFESEEINFGNVYLGQTVKVNDGKYNFSGLWSGNRGEHGQYGMYMGFGDNLPYLAYYSSMALANPDILSPLNGPGLKRIRSLRKALAIPTPVRKATFSAVDNNINNDPKLRAAADAGEKIVDVLDPK